MSRFLFFIYVLHDECSPVLFSKPTDGLVIIDTNKIYGYFEIDLFKIKYL